MVEMPKSIWEILSDNWETLETAESEALSKLQLADIKAKIDGGGRWLYERLYLMS